MNFENYHFHLYYPVDQVEKAQKILEDLNKDMPTLKIGRVWDKPVGPHPIGSCQVSATNNDFYELTQWFLNNRDGFSVFVHAVTGDDLRDHTDYVIWIGAEHELKLEMFKK